jgi:hypothetical protein
MLVQQRNSSYNPEELQTSTIVRTPFRYSRSLTTTWLLHDPLLFNALICPPFPSIMIEDLRPKVKRIESVAYEIFQTLVLMRVRRGQCQDSEVSGSDGAHYNKTAQPK